MNDNDFDIERATREDLRRIMPTLPNPVMARNLAELRNVILNDLRATYRPHERGRGIKLCKPQESEGLK